jgi:hypothetical protein
VPSGAQRCPVVPSGARWCPVVPSSARVGTCESIVELSDVHGLDQICKAPQSSLHTLHARYVVQDTHILTRAGPWLFPNRQAVVKLGASVDISSQNVTSENVSMTHPVHLG